MRAMMCTEHGGPTSLTLDEVEAPAAGEGEVVIDIEAASVNFPDVLMTEGKYQAQPPLPFAPGSEVAGVVSSVGPEVDGFSEGDRVFALTGSGGFAEQVAANAGQVFAIPDGVAFEPAAAFFMTYATSYYALKDRGHLQPGETLLVLGAAGGVGLAAVELGRLMGARVIAAASTDEKLALGKEFGADSGINYETEDLKVRTRELTDGDGADVVYDAVGGGYSEPALRATAWKGRFLVIGFAAGDIPKLPLNLVLLRGCDVVGVFWGMSTFRDAALHQANTRELIEWLAEGRINPHISATYSLERAADALVDMAERRVTGKVVVLPGD